MSERENNVRKKKFRRGKNWRLYIKYINLRDFFRKISNLKANGKNFEIIT